MRSLTSRSWLRLVLACYLMVLGVAGASAVVHPQRMEVVCTADGAMKMVTVQGAASQHTLDCSLCLAAALPAPPASALAPRPQPRVQALAAADAGAHIPLRSGARFPPRGPPLRT